MTESTDAAPPQLPDDYEYEVVDVDDLQLHPDNPRRGSVTLVKRLIERNGYVSPVVAQRSTGRILNGNHRYRAALELGYRQIPTIWRDVDDTKAREIMLGDNRASDEATYDQTVLLENLRIVQDDLGDLEGTGFNDADLEELHRITGDLADEQTDWLDDLIGAATPDDDTPRTNRIRDDLTFPLEAEQRDTVLAAVRLAKRQTGDGHSGRALTHLCADWLASQDEEPT